MRFWRNKRIAGCILLMLSVSAQAQELRILVQQSPLAGFQYHAAAGLWQEMRVGDAVTLTREPENPHDRYAVRVDWRGQHLGYLPRAENRAVAREMDRLRQAPDDGARVEARSEARVEARVARLQESRNPWQRVLLDVFVVF